MVRAWGAVLSVINNAGRETLDLIRIMRTIEHSAIVIKRRVYRIKIISRASRLSRCRPVPFAVPYWMHRRCRRAPLCLPMVLTLLLLALSQTDTRAAAVLVDEVDTGSFQNHLDGNEGRCIAYVFPRFYIADRVAMKLGRFREVPDRPI